jgi:VanZ family protein
MPFRRLFAILFFTWLTALLFLTFYPNLPEMKIKVHNNWFRLDYLGHFGFYTGLSALFLIWQAGWRAKIPGRLITWTIIGGIILGTATEFTQLAIPGRHFNPVDMAFNFIGIFIGVAVVHLMSRKSDKVIR